MKNVARMLAALVTVAGLCTGCEKAAKPKPKSEVKPALKPEPAKLPKERNAADWEPETAGGPPAEPAPAKLQEESKTAGWEPEEAEEPKARKTEVKNEAVFMVPRKYQREMGLTMVPLTATDTGLVMVPNESILVLDNLKAVFIWLEDD